MRREVLILLPATLLLLLLISTFILFSLKSALSRWQEERCDAVSAIASRLIRQMGEGGSGEPTGSMGAAGSAATYLPSEGDLARLADPVRALGGAVAIVDERGSALVQVGPYMPLRALEGDAGGAGAWGPRETGGDFVTARVPFRGANRALVVELPAPALAGQLRAVRWLGWVVLPVNVSLLVLALFSLQQILGPWERLLAGAEQIGGMRLGDQDEVDFLLATLEQALSAERSGGSGLGEDDLAALDRTLSPSLQSGLLLLGREGEVLALNDLGASLLGLPALRRGPAPSDVGALLADRPELLGLILPAVRSGAGVQREEVSLETPMEGGRRTTVLGLSVHPLRPKEGEVRGHLVLFTDLTEVRQRRERTRVAEGLSQLGEMAAGIAHELRNGLATLRGYLTLIERKVDAEAVGGYLAEMRLEADHLEQVASDFLEFARPGAARLLPVALDGLLKRAAGDPALGEMPVEVSGDSCLVASGDEPLLSRALKNLLLNAADAERRAGRQGPLEIAARKVSSDQIEIEIRDRGPGVPPAIRERLFQPFASGRPGGVGLGLSLAFRIANLHGGTLELADRDGGGTIATFLLPAAS